VSVTGAMACITPRNPKGATHLRIRAVHVSRHDICAVRHGARCGTVAAVPLKP
jgi:hypothetical protein